MTRRSTAPVRLYTHIITQYYCCDGSVCRFFLLNSPPPPTRFVYSLSTTPPQVQIRMHHLCGRPSVYSPRGPSRPYNIGTREPDSRTSTERTDIRRRRRRRRQTKRFFSFEQTAILYYDRLYCKIIYV